VPSLKSSTSLATPVLNATASKAVASAAAARMCSRARGPGSNEPVERAGPAMSLTERSQDPQGELATSATWSSRYPK
jgi:hypothetical protein